MSKRFWVGCDMAKATFWVSVSDLRQGVQGWTELPAECFENTSAGIEAFVAWLSKQGVDAQSVAGVCLEATGRLSVRWTKALDDRLGPVSIVNPALPNAHRKSLGIRDKTDRVDACVLALFAKATAPAPTVFRSPMRQELCELYRLRESLNAQCHANEQRLADGPTSACVRVTLAKMIKAQKRQVENVEKQMDAVIAQDPQLRQDARRIESISGVGRKTAWIILSEFHDLRQYKRNELVALAGLFPKQTTSGTSVHKKARLAKGGGGRVRKTLYLCAMSAKVYNPQMRQFAQRLEANGKEPMEAIGAVMRKLLLVIRAVVVNERDYDPQWVPGCSQ